MCKHQSPLLPSRPTNWILNREIKGILLSNHPRSGASTSDTGRVTRMLMAQTIRGYRWVLNKVEENPSRQVLSLCPYSSEFSCDNSHCRGVEGWREIPGHSHKAWSHLSCRAMMGHNWLNCVYIIGSCIILEAVKDSVSLQPSLPQQWTNRHQTSKLQQPSLVTRPSYHFFISFLYTFS